MSSRGSGQDDNDGCVGCFWLVVLCVVGFFVIQGILEGSDDDPKGRCVEWEDPDPFGGGGCIEWEALEDEPGYEPPDYVAPRDYQPAANSQPRSTGGDLDCNDFTTHTQAQAFFRSQGGPASDPHLLDEDNDGIACESLR